MLALLGGRPEAVEGLLSAWPDLARNFARAEVLLAAADDLRDRPDACGRRLAGLAEEWPAEPLYAYLMAGHHLRQRRYEEAADVLGRWPANPGNEPDLRPLYFEGLLAVCRGREPDVSSWPDPSADEEEDGVLDPAGCPRPRATAWRFLGARALFLAGDHGGCWEACRGLVEAGVVTERVVKLQILAASGGGAPDDWLPTPVLPDSSLPGLVALDVAAGRDATAAGTRQLGAHPEDLTALWMMPAFWLEPVRGWIA